MNQPLPLQLEKATVTICEDVVTICAHGMHIKHRLPKLMADAVWEQFGADRRVSVTMNAPTVTVELERGLRIRVRFGPLSVARPVLHSWWRFLESRETAERGVAHVA